MKNTRELIYEYVIQYKRDNDGLSPSFDQIGDSLGVSKTNVAKHINILRAAGQLGAVPTETGKQKHGGIIVSGGVWLMMSELRAMIEQEVQRALANVE